MVNDSTVADWELRIGEQVRRARLLDDLDQVGLAAAANVSLSSLRGLEAGRGSTLRTLISVLRALNRTEWLTELEPEPELSPIALARARDGLREPQRATRRSRS